MSVRVKRALFFTIDASKLDVLEHDLQDNLRYDVAFPAFHTKTGVLGGLPSGRWSNMFNLREDDSIRPVQGASILYTEQDDWVTYRHPVDPDGRTRYSDLVPVTLRAFIAEKNAEDKRR